jgi:hypothetical protein
MSRRESGGELTMGCIVILLIIPIGIFMRAWALTMMWGWFVTPFGLMHLGYAHALGLASCVALFSGVTGLQNKDDDEDKTIWTLVGKTFVGAVIIPLFVVGMGWVFHQYM